jgi:hypothetical protein
VVFVATYGAALFFGAPVAIGATSGCIYNREAGRGVGWTLLAYGGFTRGLAVSSRT